MKRCPECRRDYYDHSLIYCLDDGNELLEGPASVDKPATAILSVPPAVADGLTSPGESLTRPQIHTTDQTAIFQTAMEAEPQNLSGSLSERQSLSAHRAAEPQGKRNKLLAIFGIVVLLLIAGFFGYRYLESAVSKQIESIAVMPFVNESGNADIEYLSDGMTETLISSLSQLANLNVKPRSSVFRYKGKDADPQSIGKELNVQAVLNGRVVQHGQDLSLFVELIDVSLNKVVWSQQYNRKQSDLATLQSDIARDVSNKLRTKLSGTEQDQIAKTYTTNADAYQLYLKGRYYWNKRTEADIKRSIEFFDQAIALDPAYALAYAGLADAWQVLPSYMEDRLPDETYPKARAAAQKALEIDPTLAEPHAALGVVLHEYDWNFAEAEKEFKRVIELNPNYASAHQWYSEYLLSMGRLDEALSEAKRAQQLDPLSLAANTELGGCYYLSRRYDEAIAQQLKTLEIDPNFPSPYDQLTLNYIAKGMYIEAIEEGRKMRLLQGLPPELVEKRTAEVIEAFHKDGPHGFWQKILEIEQETARQKHKEISPITLARYQNQLGNKEQALDALEKALASGTRDLALVQLKAEPSWDPIRSDPRFQELLRKIGFPQ